MSLNFCNACETRVGCRSVQRCQLAGKLKGVLMPDMSTIEIQETMCKWVFGHAYEINKDEKDRARMRSEVVDFYHAIMSHGTKL